MPCTANRQTLVSLTLARGEVPVMLALRLFLPGSWTSKRARLERAGVPAEYRTARTKPEMALAEIDRAAADQGQGSATSARLIGEHRMLGEKKYYLANLFCVQ